MKRLTLILFFVVFTGFGCEDLNINTDKNTADDPIGDITYFNDSFHTTNIDTSGHAGSQIDLIRLSETGQRINQTPLEMNGQGYMALSDDEEKFFLLSRRYNTLYSITTSGEKIQGQWAQLEDHWSATALAYVDDREELLILYRNSVEPSQYRARLVNPNNINEHSRDLVFNYYFVSTKQTGIYALAYNDNQFYALGINHEGDRILIETDFDFEVTNQTMLGSDEIAGLDFKDGNLYFSYFDGTVQPAED